ncbi:MAG: RsmE family RNA methyltransferase [Candidatus Latescibacterota bacterium]|nr:RsmE family RNA methyltransferase [Candidatus Latescibacterota bacterium]
MNIILFHEVELGQTLPVEDKRAKHLLEVLRFREGNVFDAGIINGPRGKARIVSVGRRGLQMDFSFTSESPSLYPVEMIIGAVRPSSSRRILKDVTTQGASVLHFVGTDRGENSYLKSSLWTKEEYRRLLREGAEQAFCTRIPEVYLYKSLKQCLEALEPGFDRIALDNYEAESLLSDYAPKDEGCFLALGSERGWSSNERGQLREADFLMMGLGSRVLKTETACIAGLAVLLSRMDCKE